MSRRRPTAFEVSFPDEVRREEALKRKREADETEKKRLEASLAAQQVDIKKLKRLEREKQRREKGEIRRGDSLLKKRTAEEFADAEMEVLPPRPMKKQQMDLPTEYYVSRPEGEVQERADTFLEGEDELFSDSDADDDDLETPIQAGRSQHRQQKNTQPKSKPIRIITKFTIFDSRHRNEYVLLSKIEEEDGMDRKFEVTGWVVPFYAQEEDLVGGDGNDERGGSADDEVQPVFMRVGPVLRYTIDWTHNDDTIYIETQHAWYILKMPTEKYKPWYQRFYAPRRITQMIICNAIKKSHLKFESFVSGALAQSVDIFGERYDEGDLWNAAEIIRDAIDEVEKEEKDIRIRRVPAIFHILQHAPQAPRLRNSSRSSFLCNHLRGPPRLKTHHGLTVGLRNPDLAVLQVENQNPTHVTPLIASLAKGHIREELIVMGPPPKKVDEVQVERQKRKNLEVLWGLIQRAKTGLLDVDWKKEDRVNVKSNFLRKIWVSGVIYQPGDFVLVPHGKYGGRDPPEWPKDIRHVPSTASIASYFWFARIMYIKNEERVAHVQWLEHGSQMLLQEFAHPQELFFNSLCNPVPLGSLVAQAKVHVDPAGSVKQDEFFVRYHHDKVLATFTAVKDDYHAHLKDYAPAINNRLGSSVPLNYCASCIAMEEDTDKLQWRDEARSRGQEKIKNKEELGIVFGGNTYHVFDFVLYRSDQGPSKIGQIVEILRPAGGRARLRLRVKKVGRLWDLVGKIVSSAEEIKDERHVFLTDEEDVLPYTEIITKCMVFSRESFGQRLSLRNWLDLSPTHFYLQYHFPTLRPEAWDEKTRISFRNLSVCPSCTREALATYYDVQNFKTKMQGSPMTVLDLFGGAGAFSLGLKEGSGCLKVTHALEISPSAAKTIRRNCTGTQVINQCVNHVLQYVIKKHAGHDVNRPLQLWDGKTPIPEVPRPGSVDVITAGFPCQTHSGLNMFKTANDAKSNLMLTALSWVDYYRPKYVFVENVAGFLSFNLDTRQAGLHRVEGGVTMGGLKLLVRALLDMRYQVRYSLLQAGHYGTPQRRVRFFLVASQSTLPLPNLPQPTHDFPQSHKLFITMPNGDVVRPIRPGPGTAPHPFVSIEDAIGDLPKFDWKRPGQTRRPRDDNTRGDIPALVCEHKKAHCGYEGRKEYACEPRTRYQKDARGKETTNLQHFTKTVKAKKVDRVLAIPLKPGADYRSLRPDMHEWQWANPISSTGRQNFKPGWYGRLDKDSCFPTIVTNIDPMAKQCRVLHPSCKRMVTVRELARAQGFPDSFVFESYRGNVVTMHRQIGNAVPLPLGRALGREFRETLYQEWKQGRLDVPERDEDEEMGDIEDYEDSDMRGVNRNDDQEMRGVDRDSDVDSNEGLYV